MDFTDELIRNTTAPELSSEGMISPLVFSSYFLSLPSNTSSLNIDYGIFYPLILPLFCVATAPSNSQRAPAPLIPITKKCIVTQVRFIVMVMGIALI